MAETNANRNRISQAFLTHSIDLNTRFAQKAYDRVFDSVSGSLYILGIVLRIVGSEDEAQKVEKVVDDLVDQVEKELDAEIARLDAVRKENGVNVQANYTNPVHYKVHITSPRAARFLSLIHKLDQLAERLDVLWLLNILTEQQYTSVSYQWQRRVVRLANRIREIVRRAIASAKNKGQEVEEKVTKEVENAGVKIEETIPEEDAGEKKAA